MRLLKKYKYFLFLFFIILLYFLISPSLLFDSTWEYGMAHAIKIGEIPYKDFNTISTPFFIFLHSIFLYIYDSFFTYLLINSFICVFLYYLYDKLLQEKALLYLALSSVFLFQIFVPSYNFLAFVLIVFLIFLEKNNKNDYLIGLILSLLFFTKHTIGILIIFFSFIGVKNLNNIKKRMIVICGNILLFVLYLLVTNSFSDFIDLCFLGLFDFSTKNSLFFNTYFIMSILFLGISIYCLFRYKDIEYYYLFGSFSFVIPIFDISHFVFLFSIFILCIGMKLPSLSFRYSLLGCVILCFTLIIYFNLYAPYYSNATFFNQKYFKYNIVTKNYKEEFSSVLDGCSKYNCIVIDFFSTKYDMILDNDISYYDMLLIGNYGRNGSKKIIDMINKSKNQYYIITKSTYGNREYISQMDYEVIDYIYGNLEKVQEMKYYDVFYKK